MAARAACVVVAGVILGGCQGWPTGAGAGAVWTDLIQDGTLAGWRETGNWVNVGGAAMSDADERVLATQPGAGVLVNGPDGRTVDLLTVAEFGDIEAHIEFMVPRGSNSGVYFMGRYEIQVLDSYGKEDPAFDDCGGIYQRWDPAREGGPGYEGKPPRINAARPAGQWQTFDVVFRAPRFDADGNKTADACFVRVTHNGVVVHEDEQLSGPTRAARFDNEAPTGPLMFQGDHGPVAYRNLRVRPLAD